MSGGRWNYKQTEVQELGWKLQKEPNPVLRAMGLHLEAIAEEMEEADRYLSGDSGEQYDFSKMAALLPEAERTKAYLAVVDQAKTLLLGSAPASKEFFP